MLERKVVIRTIDAFMADRLGDAIHSARRIGVLIFYRILAFQELDVFRSYFDNRSFLTVLVFIASLTETSVNTDKGTLETVFGNVFRCLAPAGARNEACALFATGTDWIIDCDSERSHGSSGIRSSELRITDNATD